MAISSPGIGSNLDINGIISKLMQVESQPLRMLARKEASFQAKLSAFGSLSGALGAFQGALGGLNNPSTFQSLNATASDTSVVAATASAKASAGAYQLNVTQLAQAQTISTQGVASNTATIGEGIATKITFQFGTIDGGTPDQNGYYGGGTTFTQNASQPSGTVTIDSSNNSLQGIRDAINKANIGVSASIISDGSSAPNRLVLTSTKTGLASSMKITVEAASSSDPTAPVDPAIKSLLTYDPAGTQNLRQNVVAQDSKLTINGIAISSPTASVSDAIEGVTLNLAKTGTATVTVARNTGAVQAGINSLVKAYNELNTTIKNLTNYDPATKQGGPLVGDSTPRNIQAQIRKMLSTPLGDGANGFTSLSQIGISIQKDGTMSLDSSKLQTALGANPAGVAALFTSFGTTTDSLVAFTGSTAATRAGTYGVVVQTLARQGQVVGDKKPDIDPDTGESTGKTVITASNKDLTVTVDGTSATVSLLEKEGGYSPDELAAQVQSAINGASALSAAGISVTATIDATSGYLKITSNRYGSASSISVSGSSVPYLFGTPNSQPGTDVAGSIGGVSGVGSGQTLTGANGAPSEGLKLLISGGGATARGSVAFSQGYAFQLNKLIDNFIGTGGLLKGRTEGIDRSIKDIDKTRASLGNRLAETEKRYRAQFTALDTAISRMTQTSNYLSQQLAQIANLSKE